MARLKMIEGVEVVERVFGAAPREMQEKIAHALNLGGKEIADLAKSIAPVGGYAGGGDLAENIEVEARGLRLRADGRAVEVLVVAGTRTDTASYARQQEFGRAGGPDGHPGHQPQPFMFPAYWAKRQRVRGRVSRAVKAAAKALARLGNG